MKSSASRLVDVICFPTETLIIEESVWVTLQLKEHNATLSARFELINKRNRTFTNFLSIFFCFYFYKKEEKKDEEFPHFMYVFQKSMLLSKGGDWNIENACWSLKTVNYLTKSCHSIFSEIFLNFSNHPSRAHSQLNRVIFQQIRHRSSVSQSDSEKR